MLSTNTHRPVGIGGVEVKAKQEGNDFLIEVSFLSEQSDIALESISQSRVSLLPSQLLRIHTAVNSCLRPQSDLDGLFGTFNINLQFHGAC